MEENFNLFVNGRQPQFVCNWKTTSVFVIRNGMEYDLYIFVNERQLPFLEMEDGLNIFLNGSRHNFLIWR
jgi:hypothetical protein